MTDAPSDKPRRRMLRWLAAVGLGLLVLALGVAGWLLGTQSGLDRGSRWLAQATGGAVHVEGARGRLAGPLEIAQLRIRTADVHVEAGRIRLDWSPAALLRGRLSVHSLSVERVRLATAPGDDTPAQAPTGFELPVALALDHVRVGQLALAAFPLDDGAGQIVAAPLVAHASAADGRIDVTVEEVASPWGRANAALTLGTAAPMALAGRAHLSTPLAGPPVTMEFTVGGVLAAIELKAKAQGADATAHAEGVIAPFDAVPLRVLTLSAEGIDPRRWRDDLPMAEVSLSARLTIEDGTLVGPLQLANAAAGTLDAGRVPVTALSAQLRAGAQSVRLDELRLQTGAQGQLTGTTAWAAQAPATAEVRIAHIDLKAIDTRLPATALNGPLTLSADEAGQHLRAQVADAGLNVELTAHHADEVVTVESLRLQQRGAEARASGTVALGGAMPFAAKIQARAVNPQAFWAEAPEGALNGDIELKGAAQTPEASGRYTLGKSRLAGQALTGEGRFAWQGERLATVDATLSVGDNRLHARGAWGAIGDVLDIDLDAPHLAQLDVGVSGALSVRGQLSGGLARPSGHAVGHARALVLPGDVRLGRADLSADLKEGVDGRFALEVDAAAIHVGDNIEVTSAKVHAAGTRGAHVIEVNGVTPLDTVGAQLRGGLDKDTRWRGQLSRLELSGRLPATLLAPVDLAFAPAQVIVGAGRLKAGSAGEVVLEPTRWSPGKLTTRGRLSGLTLGLETRPDTPPRRGSGDLVLGGEWDLDFDQQARGTVHVFRESGDLVLGGDTVVRFGLARLDVLANVDQQRLAVSVDAAGSALGELTGSATARLERVDGVWQLDQGAPLLGSADLNIPSIAWLGAVASPVVRTDGRLKAAFSLSGTPARPVGSGRINGEDLLLEIVGEGLRLAGGTLDARFDADTLEIATLRFVSPSHIKPRDARVPYAALTRTPGTLSAHGRLQLADGEGALDIEADRLPLFQRPDRWLAISGKGRMDTRWDAPRIEASMVADGGYLEFARTPAPSLSSDVKVLRDDAAAPAPGKRQLKARIGIDLGKQLYLTALGLDTRLTGQLQLVADSGEPLRATGALETVGGSYEGYGQKLTIERGVVNFQGPLDNPGLNVVALRKGLEVEAGVSISGTVRRPTVHLVSRPDVPDAEKLSWIVLGRGPEGGGAGDAALLLPAAQALLGGPGGGISKQLAAGLGLDELTIGQGELNSVGRVATSAVVGGGSATRGDATVSGQVLSVGKRLSTDTTLSFEQSLSGVEHVVKLTHQLGRRLSLVGRAGTDNAIDLRWSLSFR